jgi:hypothetical protein
MKKIIGILGLIFITLFLLGCTETSICGDGICSEEELAEGTCEDDCYGIDMNLVDEILEETGVEIEAGDLYNIQELAVQGIEVEAIGEIPEYVSNESNESPNEEETNEDSNVQIDIDDTNTNDTNSVGDSNIYNEVEITTEENTEDQNNVTQDDQNEPTDIEGDTEDANKEIAGEDEAQIESIKYFYGEYKSGDTSCEYSCPEGYVLYNAFAENPLGEGDCPHLYACYYVGDEETITLESTYVGMGNCFYSCPTGYAITGPVYAEYATNQDDCPNYVCTKTGKTDSKIVGPQLFKGDLSWGFICPSGYGLATFYSRFGTADQTQVVCENVLN